MHAFDRRTDRQTDRNLIVRPRLHSMQRGKNVTLYRRVYNDRSRRYIRVKGFRSMHIRLIRMAHRPLDCVLESPRISRNAPARPLIKVENWRWGNGGSVSLLALSLVPRPGAQPHLKTGLSILPLSLRPALPFLLPSLPPHPLSLLFLSTSLPPSFPPFFPSIPAIPFISPLSSFPFLGAPPLEAS